MERAGAYALVELAFYMPCAAFVGWFLGGEFCIRARGEGISSVFGFVVGLWLWLR